MPRRGVMQGMGIAILAVLFTVGWGMLWGLVPGTPAADEVAVPSYIRGQMTLLGGYVGPRNHYWSIAIVSQERCAQISGIYLFAEDVQPLGALFPNLESLTIRRHEHPITSLEHLSTKPQLEQLHANYLGLTNIDALASSPLLLTVNLQDNPIQDYGPLASLTQLEHLAIGNLEPPKVRKYEPGFWRKVEQGNTTLASLGTLGQLNFASFTMRRLTSLAQLPKMPQLETLDLGFNELTSLEGIERFPKLRNLHVHHTKITDFTPVLGLRELKELHVGGPALAEADPAILTTLKERGIEVHFR